MIYRWLTLSLCLQLARACVPVKPGEDLPCPSVPQGQAVDFPLYLTSPLKKKIVNGAMVYYCDAPEKPLSSDGGAVTELDQAGTVTCKPNSGMYVLDDGKPVGSKKFACGEVLITCDVLPKYTGMITGVDLTDVPAPTMVNGDTVYECPAPSRLYKVFDMMETMSTPQPAGTKVVCPRQMDMYMIQPAGTPVDTMESFICGTLACQKCEMKFLEPSNAACNTQPNMFCEGKPIVADNANMCPVLSCAVDTELFILVDATTSMSVQNPMDITCDSGTWKNGANDVPATAIGFVCGKPATCNACATKVMEAYTNMDATWAMVMGTQFPTPDAKPTCSYTCPMDYTMTVNGVAHQRVDCQMATEVVTSEDGMTLDMNNQFSCESCLCMPEALLNGQVGGLCPKGVACAVPIIMGACAASCPAGSTPKYLNALKEKKDSATIQCLGMDWIEMGSDTAAGVTCEFPPNAGFTTTPPPNTCSAPNDLGCPGCVYNQLIYVAGGTGYELMCKEGSLMTDMTVPGDQVICEQGNFMPAITMASCSGNMDPAQVADCLAEMTDTSITNNINFECGFAACYMSCKGANQKFQYEINGVMKMNEQYLKCYQAEPYPVNLDIGIVSTTIKCI